MTNDAILLTLRRDIAISCITRMSSLKLTSKPRDIAALDFLCGASAALKSLGYTDATNPLLSLIWMVSLQGFREVIEVAIAGTDVAVKEPV